MSTPSLSPIARAHRRRLTAVVGLLITLGCIDVERPTAVPIQAGASNVVAPGAVAAASTAIEDALDRITPLLVDEPAAKPLRMALESLIDALSQQGAAAPVAAVQRVEQTLDAYSLAVGPESGDAAEQDVIALALARVRAQLDAPSVTTR
jgi:hypothetical protein